MGLSFLTISLEKLKQYIGRQKFKIGYEKVFDLGGTACATLIKLKIINEFIQIERPKHLTKSKIYTLINQLMNTENICN